jgi:D-lactate dehydrogenase (cytochrome)
VLPNGQAIKTRRRARKSAAGFDTTKLFIGAEGTLGIVTEGVHHRLDKHFLRPMLMHFPSATLRLTPVLPTKVAMAQFPDVQQAANAVQEILNSPQGIHIREFQRVIRVVAILIQKK